ncbi:hypothetical protein GQ55_4G105400 [Panicum hallii var. hallii]|uniref:Uncharacterized protein n=1 Tax=Panicum hallii var. hallii TaxID=1504633 RepID=A0A2T7DX99_9POAL|nr:hypothetical protein GQ55_4G105400 [Panicum hallii var. hallii]
MYSCAGRPAPLAAHPDASGLQTGDVPSAVDNPFFSGEILLLLPVVGAPVFAVLFLRGPQLRFSAAPATWRPPRRTFGRPGRGVDRRRGPIVPSCPPHVTVSWRDC